MITGSITAERSPMITLKVRGSELVWKEVSVLLDTGFSEFLSLSNDVIQSLGLTLFGREEARLADGRLEECLVYIGTVLWDDEERIVWIHSSAVEPHLLGMAMLHDHLVTLDVTYQGSVTITRRT